MNFETPSDNCNFNSETGKWDWEPGIFWKRDANKERIVPADVCPEQLANRTPEQECQDLLDMYAQAQMWEFLLNEYHFDTTLEALEDRVKELDPESGEFRIGMLKKVRNGFYKIFDK